MGKSRLIKKRFLGFTLTEIAIVIGVMGSVIGAMWLAYGQVSNGKKIERATEEIRFIVNKIHSLYAVNPNLFSLRDDLGCKVSSKLCPLSSCVPTYPLTPPFLGCPAMPPCGTQCHDPSVGCVNGAEAMSDSSLQSLVAPLVPAGVFPSEMVSGNGAIPSPYVVSSPWGIGDVTLTTTIYSNSCTGTNLALANAWYAGSPPWGSNMTYNSGDGGVAATSFTTSGSMTLSYTDVPVASCIKMLNRMSDELISWGLINLTVGNYYGKNNITASDMVSSNFTVWCQTAGPKPVTISMTFPIHG